LTQSRLLAAGGGPALSRNDLIQQAVGVVAVVTDRTIDVHLTALRRKLGPARRHVQTVRSVGYRLADEEDGETA